VSDALPRSFYETDALRLARRLLGKVLVHDGAGGATACRIVEVEAYRGPEDRAAHTAGGRRTPRNEVMWGPAGHLYVYFVYGMHWCANVVAGGEGIPEAVLLRAAEPVSGVELMRERRAASRRAGAPPADHLLRGPANLCVAMGLGRAHDGADLAADRAAVRILDAPPVAARALARSPRVGVAYAGDHALRPWRLYIAASRAVSGPRA
jgi:DNA-3-methyladenine glycosylase